MRRELQRLATNITESSDNTEEGASESSVAILPFRNLSGDPDQEYFCDGIVEELIDILMGLEGLRVASASASFCFRDKSDDLVSAASQLGVASLVEGSVRRAGDRLRISVRLVDPRTGSPLWSQRFDREVADIFEIQDEVAAAVGRALGSSGGSAVRRRTNMEAFEANLRGRYEFGRYTESSLKVAIGHFERALELDPEMATAHAGIAECLVELTAAFCVPEAESGAARRAAERALELDPRSADAHIALGSVLTITRDLDANAAYARATELRPRSAQALAFHAWSLVCQTRDFRRAIELARAAGRTDPEDMHPRVVASWVLSIAGEHELALA